jgi:hypothetical protein
MHNNAGLSALAILVSICATDWRRTKQEHEGDGKKMERIAKEQMFNTFCPISILFSSRN